MISGPLALVPIHESIKGAPDGHSELGASSSYRWLNSAGCRALIKTCPPGTSSKEADDGNSAHHAVAIRLATGKYPDGTLADWIPHLDVYADYLLAVAKRHVLLCGKEVSCLVEQRVGAPEIHPDLWGTLDGGIYCHECGELTIGDLKFGEGIFVEVSPNPQIRLYAGYAITTFDLRPTAVNVFICQPRIDCAEGPIRKETVPLAEIEALLKSARTAALASQAAGAVRTPGDWCRKTFCPAQAICPERTAANQIVLAKDFQPRQGYDPAKLAELYLKLPQIRAACEAAESFIYQEANRGVKFPGLKIVQKKLGHRKWNDTDGQIVAALKAKGLNTGDIYTQPGVKTPPQIDAVLKASGVPESKREELLAPLIKRESTGTTLAPDTDDRPALGTSAGFTARPKLDDLL